MKPIAWILLSILLMLPLAVGEQHTLDLDRALATPSLDLLLGADHLGRDVAARLAAGSWRSILVVAMVAAIAVPLGLVLGLAPSLWPAAERPVEFVVRLFTAIHAFVLALAITALFGLSPVSAGLALGLAAAAQYGLVIAAHARACLREPYALAARALGASRFAITRRHILPAVLPPLRVHLGSDLARAVIAYSGLAFIGLGADTSAPDWGAMAWEFRYYLFDAPRLVVAPVVAITVLALSVHLLLDAQVPQSMRTGRHPSGTPMRKTNT